MKFYLLSLLFAGSLLAGIYDDSYSLTKTNHKVVIQEEDLFMQGEFIEIKRFDKLIFSEGFLDESSYEDLGMIMKDIKSYIKDERNIRITIIGHADEKVDIYNGVLKNEEAYLSSFKESESYAKDIAKIFEDNGISKKFMFVQHRGAKDLAYTNQTAGGQGLSNRVMVSMYVLSSADKDSDLDGVLDSKDECVNTLNGVKVDLKGCPLDTDSDGILDYQDNCPETPSNVATDTQGCPFDSDFDGVLDYKDECPYTIQNLQVDTDGCAIDRTLQLNFADKSSKIPNDAYSKVRDFAEFLRANPEYKAKIMGHTDSIGKAGYNMKLSLERAYSVRSALVQEGIDESRLEAIGRGELSPIETNRTKSGRATNRRIEVKLFN